MPAVCARPTPRGPTLSSLHADPDQLAASPGPAWLGARRAEAARRLGRPELPTTDEEVWRYSRIDELDLDGIEPVTAAGEPGVPDEVHALVGSLGRRSGLAVVRNGFVVHLELDEAVAARGVRLERVAHHADGEAVLGPADEPADVFVALNEIHGPEPLVLDVPRGVVVPDPVVVVDWIDEAADGRAVFPRLIVRLGADAEARVIDWHGSADVWALAVPAAELHAGPAARLHYVNVQDRGPRLWQIAAQSSTGGADATVTASQVALGGDYARMRTSCALDGRGATGRLRAAYFGEGDQMLDFRTFQDHIVPDTTSDLLFKGAVGDRSRSVYTGLIRVRKGAKGTNAFQTNRNIKLSEGAWAESVPNLEIENNDVRCSHASTVGPVDEDQRFYLESRGVPTRVAERLIVSGFFDEVVDQLAVPELIDVVRSRIDERLDRRENGAEGDDA